MPRALRLRRVALVASAVAVGWLALVSRQRPGNTLIVIAPYRYAGTWVFDDPAAGLRREPFVAGMPEMIDALVKDIPDAEHGFRLLFSARPFPGATHNLVWQRGDRSGNWYACAELGKEGWLCPGLFRYYRKAPKVIWVRAEGPAHQSDV